jgi:hypothetical protein
VSIRDGASVGAAFFVAGDCCGQNIITIATTIAIAARVMTIIGQRFHQALSSTRGSAIRAAGGFASITGMAASAIAGCTVLTSLDGTVAVSLDNGGNPRNATLRVT